MKLRNKARQVAQTICFCVRCDSEQDAAYFFGGEGSDGQGCQVISQDNCAQVEQMGQPEIQPPQLPANRLTAIDYPGPPAGPPTRAPIYSGTGGPYGPEPDDTDLDNAYEQALGGAPLSANDAYFLGLQSGPTDRDDLPGEPGFKLPYWINPDSGAADAYETGVLDAYKRKYGGSGQ